MHNHISEADCWVLRHSAPPVSFPKKLRPKLSLKRVGHKTVYFFFFFFGFVFYFLLYCSLRWCNSPAPQGTLFKKCAHPRAASMRCFVMRDSREWTIQPSFLGKVQCICGKNGIQSQFSRVRNSLVSEVAPRTCTLAALIHFNGLLNHSFVRPPQCSSQLPWFRRKPEKNFSSQIV